MRVLKRLSKTSIGQKLIGFLFYFITKLISCSIRWEYFEQSRKSKIFDNRHKYIFCCWHNKLFLGPHLLPRNRVINALQSSHSDGMITSLAFKYLGPSAENLFSNFFAASTNALILFSLIPSTSGLLIKKYSVLTRLLP